MKKENFITAMEFCSSHSIDLTFLNRLNENGLIQLEKEEDEVFIPEEQLHDLEKIVTLYFDLDINLEGIETIIYLLHREEELREKLTVLRNRLRFYEDI